MKHIGAILVIAAAAAAMLACSNGSQKTMGADDEIIVVADSAQFAAIEELVRNAFSPPLFTPQPEDWFNLVRIDLLDLPNYKRKKNIVFIAPLDAKNDVGDFLRTALEEKVKKLVEDGKEHVFVKKDVWYSGQTVMYLTAPALDDLQNYMLTNTQQLFYFFKHAWDERETARMINLPRDEKMEERLMKDYGWSMTVINGWYMAKDSAEISSVLIRRRAPAETERWMLVHWMDSANPGLLNPSFALQTRNKLTEILYRTYDDQAFVTIDTVNYLQFDEVNFNGKFAWRISGLWRMNDYSMGGPFVGYLFYEESQQRIYYIDGSVFAPKYKKKKLIQDVDVMMHTFRTKPLPQQKPPA